MMARVEKSRPMSAREELAQLGRILRLAYAVDERPYLNELLDAMDKETPSLAANRESRDKLENDR